MITIFVEMFVHSHDTVHRIRFYMRFCNRENNYFLNKDPCFTAQAHGLGTK